MGGWVEMSNGVNAPWRGRLWMPQRRPVKNLFRHRRSLEVDVYQKRRSQMTENGARPLVLQPVYTYKTKDQRLLGSRITWRASRSPRTSRISKRSLYPCICFSSL